MDEGTDRMDGGKTDQRVRWGRDKMVHPIDRRRDWEKTIVRLVLGPRTW
jgi:hypothetical protein